MSKRFWAYMDSARGFWSLIAGLVISAIGYLVGVKKLIDWIMRKYKKT